MDLREDRSMTLFELLEELRKHPPTAPVWIYQDSPRRSATYVGGFSLYDEFVILSASDSRPYTAGDLIARLEESGMPLESTVWAGGSLPVRGIEADTAGDPVTGRMAGDPSGPPVVVVKL